MIVDLLRNDLSRVCEIGSVKGAGALRPRIFATVHHLVSVVTGRFVARQDRRRSAARRLSRRLGHGAPKIRAMEIIAELEPTSRGPHCGAIGYLSADGAMDTNIVIRSYCILKDEISFQVGGGMVADSDPQAELEESLGEGEGADRNLGPKVPRFRALTRHSAKGSAA